MWGFTLLAVVTNVGLAPQLPESQCSYNLQATSFVSQICRTQLVFKLDSVDSQCGAAIWGQPYIR